MAQHGPTYGFLLVRFQIAIESYNFVSLQFCDYLGRVMRNCVLAHMRTANSQISLRIRAVRSRPLLSANRIIGHYRMYQWRAHALMKFCACVGINLNMCILRMLEDTFSLDAAHLCFTVMSEVVALPILMIHNPRIRANLQTIQALIRVLTFEIYVLSFRFCVLYYVF